MKKVVAVEDEKLVLLGINSLFEGQNNYKLIGSFTKAKDALHYICNNPPDILLTDIKMPQMDGLELIQKVKENYPYIKVVVLSFFGDYDLVHKAFKLGIDDYILKHELEHETLFSVLENISGENRISSDYASLKMNRNNFEDLVHTPSKGLEENLLKIKGTLSTLGYDTIPDTIMIAVLQLRKRYDENYAVTGGGADLNMLYTILQNAIAETIFGHVFFYKNKDIVILINGEDDKKVERKQVLSAIFRDLSMYLSTPFFIGKSNKHHLGKFDRAYEEASTALKGAFYLKDSHILSISDSSYTRSVERKHLDNQTNILLSVDNWEAEIEKYFHDIIRFRVPLQDLYSEIIRLWESIDLWIGETFHIELSPIYSPFEIYKKIDEIDNVYTLKEWFIDTLAAVRLEINTLCNKRRRIGEMAGYIKTHYNEELTLQHLSNIFNLTPAYISEVIKKELHCGFSEYLNKVRIEEAKKLLLSSEYTSEEICYKVGYNSPSHFSKMFKKFTDMTTKSYRAILIENIE